MSGPLIAIIGDAKKGKDPRAATKAAMELGTELAQRGARLLVYGGPFLEADVVTGFVKGKPAEDGSIEKRYSIDVEPPPFQEEKDHPKLFDQKAQRGADWEVAFYRAIARADGIILIGGRNATWGRNASPVWMLFLAPMVAGTGATIRPMVDRRGTQTATWPVLATLVLGLVAGGIAGILFVTAQLTGDPKLTGTNLIGYAQRSIPYAVGVGFIAGLTANAVFGRLLGLEVVATRGVPGEAFART